MRFALREVPKRPQKLFIILITFFSIHIRLIYVRTIEQLRKNGVWQLSEI